MYLALIVLPLLGSIVSGLSINKMCAFILTLNTLLLLIVFIFSWIVCHKLAMYNISLLVFTFKLVHTDRFIGITYIVCNMFSNVIIKWSHNLKFICVRYISNIHRFYKNLKWVIDSPPKPHTFVNFPLQSSLLLGIRKMYTRKNIMIILYKLFINYTFLAIVRHIIFVVWNVDVLLDLYNPISLLYFFVSATHIMFVNYNLNSYNKPMDSVKLSELLKNLIILLTYMLTIRYGLDILCLVISPLFILDTSNKGGLDVLIYHYLYEDKILMGPQREVVRYKPSNVLYMEGTSPTSKPKITSTDTGVSSASGTATDSGSASGSSTNRLIPPVHGPNKLMDVSDQANISCDTECQCGGVVPEGNKNEYVNNHYLWMWEKFFEAGDEGLTCNTFWWRTLSTEANKSKSKILKGLLEDKIDLNKSPDHPSILNPFFNKLQTLQRDEHIKESEAKPIRNALLIACKEYKRQINDINK